MGNVTVTVRHLTVVRVDAEKSILLVKGAVPGAEGGLLEITASKTKWN
jgi:large subunit ribosomal protein L3